MADIDVTLTVVVTTPSFSASTAASSDDITIAGDSLTGYLADNLTRRVGSFTDDFAADGSFTTIPLLDVGDFPRAFYTGTTILVTSGLNVGIWTVPASGPCTAGPALAPGDKIASQSGRTATAYTLDGTTVGGIHVTAIARPADAWVIADQQAQAQVTTAPTKWARCGADIPTNNGHFATAWTIPTPTEKLRIRAMVRDIATDLGDENDGLEYHEYASESLDGLGGGDRYEVASETSWSEDFRTKVKDYAESTADGDTEEWHKANNEAPTLAPTTSGIWIEKEWEWDLAAETLTTRYRSDMLGTYIDGDGARWAVSGVRSHPGLASIADTEGEDSWVGMGHGEFHIARVRRWVDDVLVSDFDASTADEDDTTVTDAVAESSPGVPVVWTGVDLAIIEAAAASGGGAVDSVNGETGAVVLDAADVGAAATSHTHAASAVTSGTLDIARIPTGTTGSTVPFGNDSRFTDTRTPTDASVTTAKLDATLSGRIPAIVRATIDETRSAAAAKADDPTLKFAAAANTWYRIEVHLTVSGDASADMAVGMSAPSGSTLSLKLDGFGGAASGSANQAQQGSHISTAGSGGTVTSGVVASPGLAYSLTGWVQTSATAGDVTLYWGPNSNGAGTGVTRHAGSYLTHCTA